jgi:hypothetical protein
MRWVTLKPFAKPLWGSVRLWVQWHAKCSFEFYCLTTWHFSISLCWLRVYPIFENRTLPVMHFVLKSLES